MRPASADFLTDPEPRISIDDDDLDFLHGTVARLAHQRCGCGAVIRGAGADPGRSTNSTPAVAAVAWLAASDSDRPVQHLDLGHGKVVDIRRGD